MQLTAHGRLPELMRELQEMLQQTKEVLQKLPLPVSKDPVLDFAILVFKVCPPAALAAHYHTDVLQVCQTWSDMWATVWDRMPLLTTLSLVKWMVCPFPAHSAVRWPTDGLTTSSSHHTLCCLSCPSHHL